MKYMILTYASQLDFDAMSGQDDGGLDPSDFIPMYQFMQDFNRELAESGESSRPVRSPRRCTPGDCRPGWTS